MNPTTPVSEIMTTNLVTAKPSDSFDVLKNVFDTHSFHHVPVIKAGGKLVGIISKEDYLKVISFDFIQLNEESIANILKARDVMTRYPTVLEPSDTVGLAADIIMANKFHALPIVEDEVLVGIVTSHDLIGFAFKNMDIETGSEPLESLEL